MVPLPIAAASDAELSATCDGAVRKSVERAATAPIPAAVRKTLRHIVRTYRRSRFAGALSAFGSVAGEGCALFD